MSTTTQTTCPAWCTEQHEPGEDTSIAGHLRMVSMPAPLALHGEQRTVIVDGGSAWHAATVREPVTLKVMMCGSGDDTEVSVYSPEVEALCLDLTMPEVRALIDHLSDFYRRWEASR